MATCPNCGEVVMEGDPYCSNCGTTFSWSDDEDDSRDSYYYSGAGYVPSRPSVGTRLASIAGDYEYYMKKAREATRDADIIRYYNLALDYGKKYWDLADENSISNGSIPVRRHLLAFEDVERCSKRHYQLLGKYGFLTDYQTLRNDFEQLLKRSGNSERISQNESKKERYLEERSRESARRSEIWSLEKSRKNYFNYIQKANSYVRRDSAKKAIENYRKAASEHENYFSKNFTKYDGEKYKILPQPPERFTDEALYYLLELYKKTHPLLKSSKNDLQINAEIVELVGRLHKEDLEKADLEVGEIKRQRQLERQRQKEKIEDTVAEGIVRVRIARDRIFKRFR